MGFTNHVGPSFGHTQCKHLELQYLENKSIMAAIAWIAMAIENSALNKLWFYKDFKLKDPLGLEPRKLFIRKFNLEILICSRLRFILLTFVEQDWKHLDNI